MIICLLVKVVEKKRKIQIESNSSSNSSSFFWRGVFKLLYQTNNTKILSIF